MTRYNENYTIGLGYIGLYAICFISHIALSLYLISMSISAPAVSLWKHNAGLLNLTVFLRIHYAYIFVLLKSTKRNLQQ